MANWQGEMKKDMINANRDYQVVKSCFCIGPQNGDPVCPCQMAQYQEDQLAKLALEYVRKNGIKL